ncbi:MAG: apolipoprotein N-acyltransferase [Planctomycetes bacterium]|nr:apolipoprotein N-acyltransferase [Planctomycetota bacterium]
MPFAVRSILDPRRWPRPLLAASTPVLLALSAPGGGAPWLLPLALAPWAFVARRGGRYAFALDYAVGMLLQLLWVSWIASVSGVGLVITVVVEGLLFPLVGACLRGPLARWPLALALPFAWTGWEYLRGVWPLDGFPWLLLGHGAAAFPPLLALGAWVGVAGATMLCAASAGALAELAAAPAARRARVALALTAFVWIVAFAVGVSLPAPADKPGPAVVVVQPGVPQEVKREHRSLDVFVENLALTREALLSAEALLEGSVAAALLGAPFVPSAPAPFRAPAREASENRSLAPHFGPDLVAWAESMLLWIRPARPDERGYRRGEVARELEERDRRFDELFRAGWLAGGELEARGSSFWCGQVVAVRGASGAFEERNAALLFDRALGHRASARYDKRKLVPGGEYIPFLSAVPFSEAIAGAIRGAAGYLPDLAPGERSAALELAQRGSGGVWRIGAAVCLDNAYEDVFRDATGLGADLHLVVSNEGWFAGSVEQEHMLGFSAWRAAESARSVLRATNTGITALYDPSGREIRRLRDGAGRDRDVPGWMWVRVPLAGQETFYVAAGWWLAPGVASALFLYLAACSALAVMARLARRGAATDPGFSEEKSETAQGS